MFRRIAGLRRLDRLPRLGLLLFCGVVSRAEAQRLPCGWAVLAPSGSRADHPGWPRQIVPKEQACPAPDAGGSAAGDGTVLVRTAQTMLLRFDTAHSRTQLRVTALESGRLGEVIRCRSSFSGALGGIIFLGRIVDAGSLAMVGQQKGQAW